MYELKININTETDGRVFNQWLSDNYTFAGVYYTDIEVVISFISEPPQSEKDEISDYYTELTAADSIPLYKFDREEQINERTGELISQGYSYGGKIFSLSPNAQTNLIALFITKDYLPYPIRFNTIDDLEEFDAVDATEITNMYFTALNTKKGCLDSGTIIKDEIRLCTTKEEIDNVIDNR